MFYGNCVLVNDFIYFFLDFVVCFRVFEEVIESERECVGCSFVVSN